MKKPTAKDFQNHPLAAMHTAMQEWANSRDRERVEVWFTNTGSEVHTLLFVLTPAKRIETYRTQDGEIYGVEVDMAIKYFHPSLTNSTIPSLLQEIKAKYSYEAIHTRKTLDPYEEDVESLLLPEGVKLYASK